MRSVSRGIMRVGLNAVLMPLFLLLLAGSAESASPVPPRHSKKIVFRNDDPSALSNVEHERKILELFGRYSTPQTIGVIPCRSKDVIHASNTNSHSIDEAGALVQLLKEYEKSGLVHIAQHGYRHQNNELHSGLTHPGRCSEFRGLSSGAQKERISAGKTLLEDVFQQPVRVFIPPWNTFDTNTIRLLADDGYQVVSGSSTIFIGEEFPQGWTNIGPVLSMEEMLSYLEKGARGSVSSNITEQSEAVVVQYHSWDIDRPDQYTKLENLLKMLPEAGFTRVTLDALYVFYQKAAAHSAAERSRP